MCTIRKVFVYCPGCRADGDPTTNGSKRPVSFFTNKIIRCQSFEQDQQARLDKQRARAEEAAGLERDRLEAISKEEEELAKQKTEKKAERKPKKAADKNGTGEPGKKTTKIDEKQQKMREEAARIAAEGDEEDVPTPVKANKPQEQKSTAFSGVMKKIEKEKQQVRGKALRKLAKVGKKTNREIKIVKRGMHLIHGETVKVEKMCNAHIKMFAAGDERMEGTLRAEARDAEKRVVPGDLATVTKWRKERKEERKKAEIVDSFLESTRFDEEVDTDMWLKDKENVAPWENVKDVEMGGTDD